MPTAAPDLRPPAADGDAAGRTAAAGRPAPDGLAGEIGKRCGFESAEEEAYLNIVRTADRLSRHFDRLMKRRGLSQPLYNSVRILVGAERVAGKCDGAAFRGLTITEIGDRLVAHAPDVTRLADRMEKLGLAERRRCSADRRSVRLFPTAKGRAAVAELADPLREALREQLGHLGTEKLHALSALLTEARAAAGGSPPPST